MKKLVSKTNGITLKASEISMIRPQNILPGFNFCDDFWAFVVFGRA